MSLADQQWCPTSVQVTALQARGLRGKGKSGTNDAYAVLQVGKEKFQTSVVEKSVTPVWKEEATFDLPPLQVRGGGGSELSTLQVQVLHRALVGPDKLLGQAVINLLQLSEDTTRNKTEWFRLLDKQGKPDKDRGEVLLDIQFMRNNMTASMFDLSAAGKSRSRLGKFKDKVRGKKKELESSSGVVPALTQVMTDSEEEANGDGKEAAKKDGKSKKLKVKSLFSSKSNLQKTMSQSMSTLPVKNSSLSGSQSSGLNTDPTEGKKKFKFKIHKRSGSSDSKDLSVGNQKRPSVEQSNMCINGSHVYCEEPQPRTSRAGSNFSLASSGHGSMEDVPDNSSPSLESLRAVRQYSPWMEEEEEEEDEERGENKQETENQQSREDVAKMKEERRKEEEEGILKRQEELIRIIQKKEEEGKWAEEEKIREEELQRLAEEKSRLEEQEKKRLEEEKKRREEEQMEEERRRRKEEEGDILKRQEELKRIIQKKEEEKRAEEEKIREEELQRLAEEKRRLEEQEKKRQEEEKMEKDRKAQEDKERQWEEELKLVEKIRIEEEIRMEELRRQKEEEERTEEMRRKEEEEDMIRRQKELEEMRRAEGDKVEREQEEMRRKEEEEILRRQEEERRRKLEEGRQKENERKKREEEMRKKEEEDRARKQKEDEEMKREQEERKRKEEEEMLRRQEELEREQEKLRLEREAEEERLKREEEERIRVEEEIQREEEERRLKELERLRQEEEERMRKEEQEKMRIKEKRRQEDAERARRMEENERIAQLRRLEEQKKRQTEEEKLRKEEEEWKLKEENLINEQRAAELISTNPFDEDFSQSPFEETANFSSEAHSHTVKEGTVKQRCESAVVLEGNHKVSSDKMDLIRIQREKRPAPQPPGSDQDGRQSRKVQDVAGRCMAQINNQNPDIKVKTVNVISEQNKSPTDLKNTQSLTQTSEVITAKHGKRLAPSRPQPAAKDSSELKTISSAGKIPQMGATEREQVQPIRVSNPFEDELSDQEDSSVSAPVCWPPALTQTADREAASQVKLKSSKMACAPAPPAKGDANSGDDIINTGLAAPNDQQQDSTGHLHVNNGPNQDSRHISEKPPSSRRLLPVKPLNPSDQPSTSFFQEDIKSPGNDYELHAKNKVPDTVMTGPYSQLTREELIALVLKQESQLLDKQGKISELEQYIDNLMVRIIEEQPSILMSTSASLKKVA